MILVVLVIVCSLVLGAQSPFWLVNSYLANKTIGRYETSPLPGNPYIGLGICPTYGLRCSIDFATLPKSIKDIGVSLPAPFDTAITLGDALPQGELLLYLTEVFDVSLGDIKIQGVSESPSKERITIFVDQLKLQVKTELDLINLIIPGAPVGVSTIGVSTTLNKMLQTRGTRVKIETLLEAPVGKTFANALPRNISLTNCSLDLDLAIQVVIRTGYPFGGSQTSLTNFVIGFIQPALGPFICNYVANQLFRTVTGSPGIVVDLLDTVSTLVGNLSTLADPVIAQEESKFVALLTPEQLPKSFSFADSSVVESIAKVVDQWLTQNNGVNQILSLLLSGSTLVLQNAERWGVNVEVPLPPFYVGVAVKNVSISGLNTFTRFSLLENGYTDGTLPASRRKYTFGNHFNLTRLGIFFSAQITLHDNLGYDDVDGGWIYNRPTYPFLNREMSFVLNYNVSLSDIALELWLSIAADASQLLSLRVGQLFGKSDPTRTTAFPQLVQALKCASPSLYGFSLAFLEFRLGKINVPNFSTVPTDDGVQTLVDDVTKLGLKVLASGITTNLPDILQHFVRPLANALIHDLFVAGGSLAACPEYEPLPNPVYPNFKTSTIFSIASDAIRSTIGGVVVADNQVSINKLIGIAVEILIDVFKFPGVSDVPGTWVFNPDVRLLAPGGKSAVFKNFKVFGINSVSQLLLETLPQHDNGLALDLSLGVNNNPIGLGFETTWIVPSANLNDFVAANFSLTGLTFGIDLVANYDLNVLYAFRVQNLLNVWCLAAPFRNGTDFKFAASIAEAKFNVRTVALGGPSSPVRAAFQALAADTNPSLTHMLNYVLASISTFVEQYKKVAFSSLALGDCLDYPSPFDSVLLGTVGQILTSNFTAIMEKGTKVQPPPEVVADYLVDLPPLGANYWDFRTSFFLPLVEDFISTVDQNEFLLLLQTLGNSTADDFVSNVFETDRRDGSVGLDVNLTKLIPPIPLDPLLDNATLSLIHLSLTNLSSLLMNSVKVLSIRNTSRFTTEWYFHLPGTLEFSFEFELTIPSKFKNPAASVYAAPLKEKFLIELSLIDFKLDVAAVSAFDMDKLGALSLANFITVDPRTQEFGPNWDAFSCLLDLFFPHGFFFPKLIASVGSYTPLRFEVLTGNAIMSSAVEQLIVSLLHVVMDFYELENVSQGFIRFFLNDIVFTPFIGNTYCPKPLVKVQNPYWNFLTSSSVRVVNNFTNSYLAGTDGKYTLLNNLVDATVDQVVLLPEETTPLKVRELFLVYNKKKLASVNLSLSDISLTGLGTVTNLNLLEGRSNSTFFNSFRVTGPVSLQFRFRYGVTYLFPKNIDDSYKMVFEVENLDVKALIETLINLNQLFAIPLESILSGNINQLACIVSAVEKVRLVSLSVLFANLSGAVTCNRCTSPYLLKYNKTFSTKEFDSVGALTAVVPSLISLGTSVLNSDEFKRAYENTLSTLNLETCSVRVDLSFFGTLINSSAPYRFYFSVIATFLVFGVMAGVAALSPLLIYRSAVLKKRLMSSELRYATLMFPNQPAMVARDMSKAERDSLSLIFHPSVNIWFKILVPVVAIVNIVLLIYSFLYFSAFAVTVSVTWLGNPSYVIPVLPLSLGDLIDYLWNSQFQLLGLGIVLLSLALPVFKNVFMIMFFVTPRWLISPEHRMMYLNFLDAIGRFSFVEGFIIVFVCGLIRLRMSLANVTLLSDLNIPDELLVIDVSAIIEMGMVVLCLAAMSTLGLNHLIMYLSEKVAWDNERFFKVLDNEKDEWLMPELVSPKRIVKDHVFSEFSERFHSSSKVMANIAMLAASFILVIGQALPLILVEFNGFLYVVSVILCPHLQMITHLILWNAPLNVVNAKRLIRLAKVFGYWASVDVFLVCITAMFFVTTPFVSYLVDVAANGVCTSLTPTTTRILGPGNGGCVQCVVYPLLGYFVAFGGMLCQVALGIVMTRASETVIKDWERTLCPPNPPRPYHFSYTEYPVLSVMLVNGCVNRRPIPRRGELAFGIASFLNDPKAQIAYHFTNLVRCCKRSCTSGLSADEMLHSSVNHGQVQQGGMDAANPIFRMETKQQPASKPKSKWNAPPSLDVQARNLQSSWNASPPVAQSAPPPRRPPKSDRVQLMGNSTQMKVQYNPDVEF